MIITIDGPTASGKSSLARALAARLNCYYLNTGLLYRALAYVLMNKNGYNQRDFQLKNIAPHDMALAATYCRYGYDATTGEYIEYDGRNITTELKTAEIDSASSLIATLVIARDCITNWSHAIARDKSLVTDGRDTGSVLFADANYKFYLTASLPIRAARWQADQLKRGKTVSLEQAQEHINDRDLRDSNRSVAPLSVAPGAIIIDNSLLSPEQTVEQVISEIIKQ